MYNKRFARGLFSIPLCRMKVGKQSGENTHHLHTVFFSFISNIHFARYCERETERKNENIQLKNNERVERRLQSRSPLRKSIILREHGGNFSFKTRATIRPHELCELLECR